MLQAILRRKARWETVYQEANSLKEDTLTAMVFGRLVYLPSDVLWNLIRSSALPTGELPTQVGAIEDVQFWPQWKLDHTLKVEKTRVEPDLLIRFSSIDVIVEAKRWDEDQQYPQQLFYEWLAWTHSEEARGGQFIMLAVGGFRDLTEEKAVAFRRNVHELVPISAAARKPLIFALSWESLLKRLIRLQESLSDNFLTQNGSTLRVIKDVVAALDLHNVYPRCWLSDLPSVAARFLGLEEESLHSLESPESMRTGFSSIGFLSLLRPISDESIRSMTMEAK